MADTGWKFPGTMVGNRTVSGSNVDWSNPDNAKLDDGNKATAVLASTEQTRGLAASNFDFSGIPVGASIDGIEVRVGDFTFPSAAGDWDNCFLILADNTDGTENKQAALPTPTGVEQTTDIGGATDLWGEGDTLDTVPLKRADVTDVDFGFFVAMTAVASPGTVSVDFMQMRVFYHEGVPTRLNFWGGVPGHSPPVKSSAGDFYAFAVDRGSSTAFTIFVHAYKSSDPTKDDWVRMDEAGAPVNGFSEFGLLSSRKGADDMVHCGYLLRGQGGGGAHSYIAADFDMSTDTWGSTNITIDGLTDDPTFNWISMAVRSNGEAVAVFSGDTDRVMGGDKERVDFRVRSGSPPVWGGATSLDAAGDVHYGNPNAVLSPKGSDDIHVLWQLTTNTADPPTAWESVAGRTIRSDDSLGTTITGTPDTGGAMHGIQNGVVYDNTVPSPDRIEAQWIAVDDGATRGQRLFLAQESNTTGDLVGGFGSDFDNFTEEPFVNGEAGINTIAALINNGSSDLHVLYSGGGTDGVDQDLYYTKSSDEGATWSTPTVEIAGITVNFISANIYERGPDTMLAYVYDDGGVQYYNEKVLFEGQSAHPAFLSIPKIGARYY